MFVEHRLIEYPLRQSLLPAAAGLAIFARRGLVDWLSKPDNYLVICEGRGGQIYAANERALEEAQEIIAAAHGDNVISREAEVHTFLDPALGTVVEPVMFLRIKAPRGYTSSVVDDLKQRGVRILEEDLQRYHVVIRGEGPLAGLLGYERELQALTNGSAAMWNWLLRYEAASQAPAGLPQNARFRRFPQHFEDPDEARDRR